MALRSTLLNALLTGGIMVAAAPASATAPTDQPIVPRAYQNCTALQVTYRHGVARAGAVDHVRGATKPVTTFTVNGIVYNLNKRLDRDRDGVACEKR